MPIEWKRDFAESEWEDQWLADDAYWNNLKKEEESESEIDEDELPEWAKTPDKSLRPWLP